jgi:hypothetical protein
MPLPFAHESFADALPPSAAQAAFALRNLLSRRNCDLENRPPVARASDRSEQLFEQNRFTVKLVFL